MQIPPPRIALIHATALAVDPIAAAFERHWPQAQRMNLLDDSLSVDRGKSGQLTDSMVQRFIDLATYAKGTGCNAILFTCSAFGPAIEAAACAVQLPTLKPNEAMFAQALALCPAAGGKLGLIATFQASIASMSGELLQMAQERGIPIELRSAFVPDAMQDLAEGRADEHHRKVAAAAQQLAGCDVVMLAQFSMADAQPAVQQALACPVLSSPDCAVLALKKEVADGA
ncbi:aspartate/glutamate racemase family protein [Caenimonas terrae]|uniref:Aspartate/glutamate racemase family protein n=1 Tax=Caenimonas terrae TaxID=696074 RepID=A0ABW0NEC1_9BURK